MSERLTFAHIFESRIIPDVYEGTMSEHDLAFALHGTVTELDPMFGIAKFTDGSWAIYVPNDKLIIIGTTSEDGRPEV